MFSLTQNPGIFLPLDSSAVAAAVSSADLTTTIVSAGTNVRGVRVSCYLMAEVGSDGTEKCIQSGVIDVPAGQAVDVVIGTQSTTARACYLRINGTIVHSTIYLPATSGYRWRVLYRLM